MKIIDGLTGFCFAVISAAVFWGLLSCFSKEDERLTWKCASACISGGIAALFNMLLYIIYGKTALYPAFSLLCLYLVITAYIDWKTLYVYRINHIIFGLAGIGAVCMYDISVSSQW